jgi:hypothetical protein
MEPEGSLPHTQEPATCPCPELEQCGPCLPIDGFIPTRNISAIDPVVL